MCRLFHIGGRVGTVGRVIIGVWVAAVVVAAAGVVVRIGRVCGGAGGGVGRGAGGGGGGAWAASLFWIIRLATRTPPKHGRAFGDGKGEAKH